MRFSGKLASLSIASFTASFAMALMLLIGIQPAEAGGRGQGDYYSTSYDADDYDEGFEGRMQRMMDQMGNVFSDFYVAARGALVLQGESTGAAPDGGRADLSGYYGSGLYTGTGTDADPRVPRPTDTDFATILNSYTEDLRELSGGFQVAAGYDVPLDFPVGGVRGEFQYGFQTYSNEVCFLNLNGDTSPMINVAVPTEDSARAAGTNTAAANLAREQARGLAREALRNNAPTQCQTQDDFVHRFLFNAFYDINLGDMMDLMGMNAGVVGGLNFHLGAGVGYALTETSLEGATIAPDANEPSFDPSANRSTTAGATLNTIPIEFNADADCATRHNVGTPAPADCGDTTSVAAPEVLESGLVVPVYGGVSYSLAELSGFPVMLEFTYRYDAVAPDNVGTHGFLFGARYHF